MDKFISGDRNIYETEKDDIDDALDLPNNGENAKMNNIVIDYDKISDSKKQ